MNKGENSYLLNAPIKKLLPKFAIPCVLSLLVGALYNIVDQIFIGNSSAGTAGIMATTLVFPFVTLALALALLAGDGAAALYSISLGAKDAKTAKKSIGNTIITLIVAGIALGIMALLFTTPILNFLGAHGYSPECQEYAKQYLQIIALGMPFYVFSCGAASLIRASGAPAYSMISTVSGAITNLVFDPIMIFGFGLGVRGAAIATIVGQIISAILCAFYFIRPPHAKKISGAESPLTSELVKLRRDSFAFDKAVFTKSAKLGISSFVTQIAIAIITIVANIVVGKIGAEHATDAGGALGIVFKVFAIIISFCIGIAVGGQPIIGFNYGAKRNDRVLETFRYVTLANIVVGLIGMALFEFLPNPIVKLFGGNATDPVFYQAFAVRSFRIYLGGILFCCIQKASCIFLQSINRPYHSMLLSLARDVIMLVPTVCIFGHLWGLNGMLWAGPVSDCCAFVVTVIIVSRERKKLKKTSTQKSKA